MSVLKKAFTVVLFTAQLLCVLPALSVLAAEPLNMERIIVTSSRTQEDVLRTPRFTTILDAADIAATNARTITDLLRCVPGVSVRDYTGTGKSVNVNMAGFGETGPSNVLVLIDGRRVNAIDLSNTDWSQIALSQVERVEVMRGAGSVLYGDNAAGGVINIITKKGAGAPHITLEAKGGSYDTWGSTFEAAGEADRTSFRLTAEALDTRGYRTNGGLERRDFGVEAGRDLNDTWRVDLTLGHHEDTYGLPGALSENNMLALGRRATIYPNDNADTRDSFLDLGVRADARERGNLEVHASVRERSVDAVYASSSWRNENHIVTWGVTPKYTLKGTIAGHANTLILGSDVYRSEDDILDGALTGANDDIEITKTSWGFYALDQADLTERLSLKAGARREAAAYDFRQITQAAVKAKSDLADEVFQGGLVYALRPESSVYVDFAQSFRHPLVDEFFTSNTWGFGGLNTALSTQKGRDIEAGIRHSFSSRLGMQINYFQHDIANEIYFNPLTFQNTNYDRTRHQGAVCEARWNVTDTLGLEASYTYTRSHFGKGAFKDNEVPGVPQHKASLRIDWQATEALYLNLFLNYVGEMYLISDLNNAFGRMNDYVTVDLKARYLWKGMEIFCGIDNVFDADYAEYGVVSTFASTRNFYPSPGRNVMAGVRVTF
ncbi:MAG: TonB-dependent receptor [Deltaproteobacteria bacterium]